MAALRTSVRLMCTSLRKCPTTGQVAMLNTISTNKETREMSEVKPFHAIPGPGGLYKWPVIGPLLHFKPFTDITAETSHRLMDEMIDKYGPVVRIQLGKYYVLISDPKDLETVLRHEGKYPLRPPLDVNVAYTERNNSKLAIQDLQGEEWHQLRAPLNKRLVKVNSAVHYLEEQSAVAQEFADILATRKLNPEETADLFFRYAPESIGLVCFNARLGFLDPDLDQESRDFLQASKDMLKYMHQTLVGESVAHTWYRNKTYREYERTLNIMKVNALKHLKKARAVLEARKKEGKLNPDEPNLLLSLLSDPAISEEVVRQLMESLYFGGTDSTAKSLQAFFYLLATNPDKQVKLRSEIINTIGHDGPLTAATLGQMKYLWICVKESFRMIYPTPCGVPRILPDDVVLSGYRIPAGTLILMHNRKACKDYFVDPEKYIPERWQRESDGSRQENVPNTASVPFGRGPRGCIGHRFAKQEIYLATAKVLQKLKIEVEPESYNTNFIYVMFAQPEKPIKFKFTKVTS